MVVPLLLLTLTDTRIASLTDCSKVAKIAGRHKIVSVSARGYASQQSSNTEKPKGTCIGTDFLLSHPLWSLHTRLCIYACKLKICTPGYTCSLQILNSQILTIETIPMVMYRGLQVICQRTELENLKITNQNWGDVICDGSNWSVLNCFCWQGTCKPRYSNLEIWLSQSLSFLVTVW